MSLPRVISIHVGKVTPLGSEGVPSGFVKHAITGSVNVSPLGLLGDEQADLRVHGGPDKAVYGYASSHYAAWRQEYPQHSNLLVPGGLGENLAIEGMTEVDLCVGDIHSIGTMPSIAKFSPSPPGTSKLLCCGYSCRQAA